MKKAKNNQKNQKKAFSSTEENNTRNLNNKNKIPKEIGTYNGFLIYDKEEKIKESDSKDKINKFFDPPLKDWLIIQHNPNKNKSRFTDLFQEILENDKKLEDQKKNKEKQSYEKSLLPNNIINDIDDDDEIKINENEIYNEDNEIVNLNSQMENINLNSNIINKGLNSNNIINDINPNIINNINQNNFSNQINSDNNINNNNFSNINNINNSERMNLNIIPNNNIINNNNNNNYQLNYNQNINNNYNTINAFKYSDNSYQSLSNSTMSISNPNSGFSSAAPTAPSSIDTKGGLFSFMSNTSSDKNKMPNNMRNKNNINDYLYFSNKSSFYEPAPKPNPRSSEKKFDLNIDIKRIICLEDRRTTLMIKNIPNKFNRDLLLSIIDQNFKKAYDLFILPTDANRYKNFGYSFINFTSSYYIPYFYFLFHRKKWSSTNSQKVCEITYSKIQGRNNLLSHYPNKNIFKNEEAKKHDISEQKYIIPNEYFNIFNSAFPNYNIEKSESYFMTKMPFKY